METKPALVGLVALMALGACGGPADPPSRAESLWAARVQYVGDNSAVASLVDEIGVAGGRSLELQTAAPPYALAITVEEPEDPEDSVDPRTQATLLLGLVANLDEVTITTGQDEVSLDAAAASRDLGHDVEQLGRDRASLERYLAQAGD